MDRYLEAVGHGDATDRYLEPVSLVLRSEHIVSARSSSIDRYLEAV